MGFKSDYICLASFEIDLLWPLLEAYIEFYELEIFCKNWLLFDTLNGDCDYDDCW